MFMPWKVIVALLASFHVVNATQYRYCRCEAEFESLYDRRQLRQGSTQRDLTYVSGHPYDYDDAYINDHGYWVVERVVVLPGDSEYCDTPRSVFYYGHRDLVENDLEDKEEMEHQNLRVLKGKGAKGSKGSKGSKSSKSSKSSKGSKSSKSSKGSSKGYFYYGGKGKV